VTDTDFIQIHLLMSDSKKIVNMRKINES